MGYKKFKVQQFIDAIPGSDGIITTIAKRIGCDWATAKKWIEKYPTIKTAYEAEKESLIDIAESVIGTNIRYARKEQEETLQRVDTADAKWYLTKKRGKEFGEKIEIVHIPDEEADEILNTLTEAINSIQKEAEDA